MDNPPQISDHPLFSGAETVGFISGESPRWPAQSQGHEAMGQALKQMGLRHEETRGRYETPEKSYIVYGPTREQMYELGKRFGQDSALYSQNGKHELMYTGGPHSGRYHPSLPQHEVFDEANKPEDYYTYLPSHKKYVRLAFDFNQKLPSPLQEPHASQALRDRAQYSDTQKSARDMALGLLGVLRKYSQLAPAKSPHHYPYHNSKTRHNPHHLGHGVLVDAGLAKSEADSPERNQGVEPDEYAQNVAAFGSLEPGSTAGPVPMLSGYVAQVDQLLNDHGYKAVYFGGRYGRPDLASKNYDTKHLPIADPSDPDPAAEGHLDAWRKLHELAHALTEPDADAVYGDGKRTGKLGAHRSLQEALRAIHWEQMATDRQRQLASQIGLQVTDEDHNRALNTNIHDAVQRLLSGDTVDSGARGFKPCAHSVPVEVAFALIRNSDQGKLNKSTNLSDSYIAKEFAVADTKNLSVPEICQALAKTLRERVAAYEKDLLELRKREIAKEEALSKPPVSEAQRRAMHAAASGHSTLDIPKSVGKDFSDADTGGKLPEKKKTGHLAKMHENMNKKSMYKTHTCPTCGQPENLCKCGPGMYKGEPKPSSKPEGAPCHNCGKDPCGCCDKCNCSPCECCDTCHGHPCRCVGKPCQVVEAEGSGGSISKGKGLKKAEGKKKPGNCLNCGKNIAAIRAGSEEPIKSPKFCTGKCAEEHAGKGVKKEEEGMEKAAMAPAGGALKPPKPPVAGGAANPAAATKPPPAPAMPKAPAAPKVAAPPMVKSEGLVKALPHLGGKDQASKDMTSSAARAAPGPTAPAAKVKAPTPQEHGARANQFEDFMPPGKFSPPPAPGKMAKPAPGAPAIGAPPKLPAASASPGTPLTPPPSGQGGAPVAAPKKGLLDRFKKAVKKAY